MSPVHVLVSPEAGRGRAQGAVTTVSDVLRAEGAEIVDITGFDTSASLAAAHTAVAEGATRLVVVGGDGLVHLALQAVAETKVVLGVVPVGTGNDFATALGLPDEPHIAARAALGGSQELDAIRVGEKWVASVATGGFSADVNERANSMRFPRGPSRYTVATLRELPRLKHRHISVTIDNVVHEFDAAMIAVGNTSSFGGGMLICPGADPTDGLLDVTVVSDIGRFELVRFLRLVFDGRHLDHPSVHTLRGREIQIAGDDLHIWGDGEPIVHSPLTLTAVPGAISLAH